MILYSLLTVALDTMHSSSSKLSRKVDNLKDGPSITILTTKLVRWQIAMQYKLLLLLRGFEWHGSALLLTVKYLLTALPGHGGEIEAVSLYWEESY
jgi:hypothetical protein